MTDAQQETVPVRTICYSHSDDVVTARDFYMGVLGFAVAMDSPVVGLASPGNPAAQVLLPEIGTEDPPPAFGVDLGAPEVVDRAHAAVKRLGLSVVYPLTDEPWGVRRFFVEDPGGTVINILAHTEPAAGQSAHND